MDFFEESIFMVILKTALLVWNWFSLFFFLMLGLEFGGVKIILLCLLTFKVFTSEEDELNCIY